MSKEKSAIDAIYSILDEISLIQKQMEVMDNNIKIISNKLNSFKPKATVNATTGDVKTGRGKGSVKKKNNTKTGSDSLVLGNITLFGEIKTKDGQDIKDVLINIYDEESKLIKSTMSGKGGYWETRLPAGRYGVEYIHNKFKPVNKVVEINDSMKRHKVV